MNLFKEKFLLSDIILLPRTLQEAWFAFQLAGASRMTFSFIKTTITRASYPRLGQFRNLSSLSPSYPVQPSHSSQHCSRLRSESHSRGQASSGLLHSAAALEESFFYPTHRLAGLCSFINRKDPHPSTSPPWDWGKPGSTVRVSRVAHWGSHNSRQVVKAQDSWALVPCSWSGKDTGVSSPCSLPPAEMLRWAAKAAFVVVQNSS